MKLLTREFGFVKPLNEDPNNRDLFSTLRDICDDDDARELIPCSMGNGTVYPPKDCWNVPESKNRKASSKTTINPSQSSLESEPQRSRKSLGGVKADKVKRIKVSMILFRFCSQLIILGDGGCK